MFLYPKETLFLANRFKEMEIRRQGHEMKAMLREDARSVLNEEANKKKKLEEKKPPPQPKAPPSSAATTQDPPRSTATTQDPSRSTATHRYHKQGKSAQTHTSGQDSTQARTTATLHYHQNNHQNHHHRPSQQHPSAWCHSMYCNWSQFWVFLLVIFVYVYTNQGEEEDMVSESNTKASYMNYLFFYIAKIRTQHSR